DAPAKGFSCCRCIFSAAASPSKWTVPRPLPHDMAHTVPGQERCDAEFPTGLLGTVDSDAPEREHRLSPGDAGYSALADRSHERFVGSNARGMVRDALGGDGR